MKTIAVLAALALLLASPIRADDGPCFQDSNGQVTCAEGPTCIYLPTSYFVAAVVLYSDLSEVHWSAAIYQNSCTGEYLYEWTPNYVYCPDWQNCQAHDLYPNVPPLP